MQQNHQTNSTFTLHPNLHLNKSSISICFKKRVKGEGYFAIQLILYFFEVFNRKQRKCPLVWLVMKD